MSDIAIKVENLSKMYRLGDIGTGSLGTDITRWWAKVRGKEDPFAKIAIANDRSQKATSDFVWSLKDLNFEIKKGEAVGIIGKNGAGKSTLLKILSRTTTPTTGSVKINGRVASLLEVGTGFHGDLTGRENIYMNGAILGMARKEITSKLEEIIDFSGVAGYIDTPVKRYSSGMYVRLAFAVAAHLDPDIMIIDEVLAVGDAEFQKKCLGKMKEVNNQQGRTVLFVSHDLNSISTLTSKCIYLVNGTINFYGSTMKTIEKYVSVKDMIRGEFIKEPKTNTPSLISARVNTSNDNFLHIHGEEISFDFVINVPFELEGFGFSFQVLDKKEQAIVYAWTFDVDRSERRLAGVYKLTCTIPKFRLYKGTYSLHIHIAETKARTYFEGLSGICEFDVDMFGKNVEWGWDENACKYIEDFIWTNNKIN